MMRDAPLAIVRIALVGLGLTAALAAAQSAVREPAAAAAQPTLVRVGLATDLETVGICCDRRIRVMAGARTLGLHRGVEVRADPAVESSAVYRLQVAALKDERQAQDLARRLARATGEPADAIFDADRDLYRVRVGRYARSEQAEAQRGRLSTLGVEQSWLVSEGGALERAALIVDQDASHLRVRGRWLAIEAPRDLGIPFARHRYRGRLLIYLNDRGLLNVINELPLEDYLRGVVPREMGPEQYDQLEALKAQSVAARTFTLSNLNEFATEGYDICSTPRCQVYGGMDVEHPLSDRAIAETVGEVVVVDGAPAEIFYTATCGGHTEDVETVFPARHGRHLRGVPCFEAGAHRLAARGDRPGEAQRSFASLLMERLLPPPPGRGEQVLSARLEHLALLAGLPSPRAELASLERATVRQYLASFLDLALDPRLLGEGPQLARLVAAPPAGWQRPERRLARRLEALLSAPARDSVLDPEARGAMLYELARYLEVLKHDSVDYLHHDSDAIHVKDRLSQARIELPAALLTAHASGDQITRGELALVPGDRITLVRHRGRLLAVLGAKLPPPVALGNRAERANWRRVRSRAEVAKSVRARYPGFPFEGFQVLARGVSGRVASLRLLGAGGRSLLVDGLAVRWTLDLPDTWFDARPTADGWIFTGHGWGHGVGMCQAGSFGMAARGASYRQILEHYFTGITIAAAGASSATRNPAPERGSGASTRVPRVAQ